MLLEATTQIATRITSAIRDAARATGASFEYLLKTALRESNLDPSAKASTSSAAGLFQFVEQTWLETVKNANPGLGYGRYAEAIVQTPSGRYAVPDPAMRKEVMALRNDPAASAAMAAAFTQRNAEILTARLGRKPTDGELYIAHFLGANGAGQLIGAAHAAPQTKAADLFPDAARANRSIFYSRGSPRTAAQVYALLAGKHERTPVLAAYTRIAGAAPAAIHKALARPSMPAAMAVAEATPAAAFAPAEGPVFHSLFQVNHRGPVSLVVSELWGARDVQFPDRLQAAPTAATPAAPALSRPLNLFQFLRPEIASRARPLA